MDCVDYPDVKKTHEKTKFYLQKLIFSIFLFASKKYFFKNKILSVKTKKLQATFLALREIPKMLQEYQKYGFPLTIFEIML